MFPNRLAPRTTARRRLAHLARLALVSATAASASAWALQPLITDDTGTQGTGGHQLELAFGHDRIRAGDARDTAHTWTPTYTYGATDTLDLFLSTSRISLRGDSGRASGWGSTVLGAKWRLWENEASATSLALKPELLLPVGHRREAAGLGVGRASGAITAIVSQGMPFGALHANGTWARDRARDAAASSTMQRLSIAPVWDLNEQWKLVGDLGVERHRTAGTPSERHRFTEVGAIYSPRTDLDLAAGLVRTVGVHSSHRSTTATLGVTWRF